MEAFEQRLLEEYNSLKEKFEKLAAFLQRDIQSNFSTYQHDLLNLQVIHMEGYLKILKLRMLDLGFVEINGEMKKA